MKRRLVLGSIPVLASALGGCVSVNLGGDAPPHAYLDLRDAQGGLHARLATPLVEALLIQPQPANALGDTLSIAYSRREHEFAFYQLASWTERPVRRLPRLLQQRLEVRGVAGAVGVLGDPMRADWLLGLAIDALHHDLRNEPGDAHLAIALDLFDRAARTRVAHRRFEARVPVARADSASAAEALSRAVAAVFDESLPWLEGELQRAVSSAR